MRPTHWLISTQVGRRDVEAALREVEAEVRRYSLGELSLFPHGALPPGVIERERRMQCVNLGRVALLREHGFQQRL